MSDNLTSTPAPDSEQELQRPENTGSAYDHFFSSICPNCRYKNDCHDLMQQNVEYAQAYWWFSHHVDLQDKTICLMTDDISLLRHLLTQNGIELPPTAVSSDDYRLHFRHIPDPRFYNRPNPADPADTSLLQEINLSTARGLFCGDADASDARFPDPFPADCGDCDSLFQCYQLIDSLVQDILSLEEEMVNWRHALVRHLALPDARDLQSDIFDNLAQRRYDDPAYQKYLRIFHYDADPMESDEHVRKLHRLAHGTDEDSVNL